MDRFLGGMEHSFWLYDRIHPVHFALCARIKGGFSIEKLRQSLASVQQQHPLLRVGIAVDGVGRPKFVEQSGEIPLRVIAREDDRAWEQELEVELSESFNWATAPLVRAVLLHSTRTSELIVTCHHSIADGLSVAYLIRDIVRGLERDRMVSSKLLDCSPMEHLFLGIEESMSEISAQIARLSQTEIVLPEYDSVVSQRPRPHLRTALLPASLTQQLQALARKEKTSVHGAIGAAFLLALARQQGAAPCQLNCLSPINLRSNLVDKVGENVGLYIALGLTKHEIGMDSSLWEIARSLKSQLAEVMMPEQLFEDASSRQRVMATLPDARTVAQGMQQQHNYNLLITNLGRLNLEQNFGSLSIEELYGPAVMAGLEGEKVVGVATLGDRLSLTLCCPSNTTSALESTTILAEALEILEDSVAVSNFRIRC